MDYIWLLVLLALGLLMILKPELLWKVEHLLTVEDGKPTELYLAGMRIGGAFFTICAICVLIYVAITA